MRKYWSDCYLNLDALPVSELFLAAVLTQEEAKSLQQAEGFKKTIIGFLFFVKK